MPRRSRLHVSGGIYYVVLRSNPGLHIFNETTDYAEFEQLLAHALARCRAELHAFCWTTDAAHLVIGIGSVPLGRIIQRLTSQYARRIHRRNNGAGHLFQQRYHAILIDPDAYLLRLVRHVHHVPVTEGLVQNPDDYRLSSHHAYLEETNIPWLCKRTVWRMLGRYGKSPDKAYRELMTRPGDPRDPIRFERGSRRDPRVLGEIEINPTATEGARAAANADVLERIIDTVVQVLSVERDALLSKSRQRQLALARAVVTWHALEKGVATLADVGRKLKRDPSTLFVAVERYRTLRPELFDPALLRDGCRTPPR